MGKGYHPHEWDYARIAKTWVKRTNARRYFRRAASKARRAGLKADQRRQEQDR